MKSKDLTPIWALVVFDPASNLLWDQRTGKDYVTHTSWSGVSIKESQGGVVVGVDRRWGLEAGLIYEVGSALIPSLDCCLLTPPLAKSYILLTSEAWVRGGGGQKQGSCDKTNHMSPPLQLVSRVLSSLVLVSGQDSELLKGYKTLQALYHWGQRSRNKDTFFGTCCVRVYREKKSWKLDNLTNSGNF